MFPIISLAIILISTVDASQYYYAPLGPWGLESTIINAKAVRDADDDIKKVKKVSRKKTGKDTDKVEEVKAVGDELEQAEEAFFHAVEKVEDAVIHAVDDEVETLFPHHSKQSEEE